MSMKPVKDINGNILKGMFRAPNGTIVVKDNDKLSRHSMAVTTRMADKLKIEKLEKTVEELTMLVKTLLESKNDH